MNTASAARYALAVDDDGLIRMNVLDILKDAGFCTLEAENGDDAIAVLEQHQASIVLQFTDVQMPGTPNGFALAREAHSRWRHISIVVASGRVRPEPNELPDGFRFLSKPFPAETVYDHLRELLSDGRKPDPLKKESSIMGQVHQLARSGS